MRALGVDGGGTGTKAALIMADGSTLQLAPGPPANGIMDRDLGQRLTALIRQTGATAVGVGLAGVRSPEDARDLAQSIEDATGVRPMVADDTTAALWGAFGPKPGAIIIAGTGSAALGRDQQGTLVRLGGHGFLVGDEGSGYWIGKELIRLALRSMTGVDPHDPDIEDLVKHQYGQTVDHIEANIYADPTDRARVASLARQAIDLQSPAVTQLWERAAYELSCLALAMQRRVGPVPVALVGGLWEALPLRASFNRTVSATTARESPSVGAARWALHAAQTAAPSRTSPTVTS